MAKQENAFNDHVVKRVISKNEFGIKEVKEIEDLKSMLFARQQYPDIVRLIKQVDFKSIRDFPDSHAGTIEGFREYLSVMKFIDQNDREYCVTVYDSDELWQDPEVIDIFPL